MSKDPVQQKIDKIIKQVIKTYNLNDKEAKEFEMATLIYDYEANDGLIITKREDVVNMYRDSETDKKLKPTQKQIIALADYIKETEDFYIFYGFYEKTDEVIKSILSEMKELKNNKKKSRER